MQVFYKAGGTFDVTPYEKQLSIIKYESALFPHDHAQSMC